MGEYEVIRGSIDGKVKYARIPIRSKTAEMMQENNISELNAENILSMPYEQAVRTIDAIVADWMYWLKRAGEMFIQIQGLQKEEDGMEAAVKHGRWKYHTNASVECSECKGVSAMRTAHCPNCGAEMDEKGEK